MSKTKKPGTSQIAVNRKARHDYFIEQTFEAGLTLTGWEVKSLRAGKVQINDSYVLIKDGEAWLFGAHISPLPTVASHTQADPMRNRKLLLHKKELDKLIGAVQRKGYTVVPLNLHWKHNLVKAEIALAKGKKTYDKRETEKRKTWEREKQRLGKIR